MELLNSSLDEVLPSVIKTLSRTFNNLHSLWKSNYKILNWYLRSRRPRSCHVRSRAGHRRHPRGHLWRRGRPARGPLAPLSVWTTALWAGHGLGAGDHTHTHTTTAAATATRCPRRARHWPAWPGKQNSKEDRWWADYIFIAVCPAGQDCDICFSFRPTMQIFFNLTVSKRLFYLTLVSKY